MDRNDQLRLTEEARADPGAYRAAIGRLMGRVHQLRIDHAEEARGGHRNLSPDSSQCMVCVTMAQVVAALRTDTVIDHASLLKRLDGAEAANQALAGLGESN